MSDEKLSGNFFIRTGRNNPDGLGLLYLLGIEIKNKN